MKFFLLAFSSGLIFTSYLNAEIIQLSNLLAMRSCENYPHKEGVNFVKGKGNSFKLFSTSISNLKYGKENLSSLEIKEAKLRAKLQMSKFIKLVNSPNSQDINFDIAKIYFSGRPIRSNLKIKNRFNNNTFGQFDSLKGVINIGLCKDGENFVMATYLMTNMTKKAADSIIQYK